VSATVLYMSVSLDGFVAGPNAGPGNGLGDGGERLHDWMHSRRADPDSGVPGRLAGVNGQLFDEIMATGRSPAGGPSSPRAAGAATTTTACRSGSSSANGPATS
jgi:hypothetical protein